MNEGKHTGITSTMPTGSCLWISGNRRISPYPIRWFTLVILSHVLRTPTLEYGHEHRTCPYTGVYSPWHDLLSMFAFIYRLQEKKTIHYEDRLWPKTSVYSPYTVFSDRLHGQLLTHTDIVTQLLGNLFFELVEYLMHKIENSTITGDKSQ